MKKIILLLITVLFLANSIWAQNPKNIDSEVTVTSAKYLGKSAKIKDLIKLDVTSKEAKDITRRKKKAPENFVGRRGNSKVIHKELEHTGPDKIRQSAFSDDAHSSADPKVNIMGLGQGSPSDPTGDVGRDFYLQAVNLTEVGVYSKEGVLVANFAMNTLWAEFNGESDGDPIILYDEHENRWIITEFTDPANILIAVSDTEDPLGSYNAYSFSTLQFPDYPKYAIWPNALVVTTNEQGAGQLTTYFIDRVALMNGENDVTIQRINVPGNNNTEAGFYVATPVDWNGSQMPLDTKPIVLALNDSSWGSTPEDVVNLYQYDIDWANAANTVVTVNSIPLSPFDSYPCADPGYGFSCIPQPNARGLDGIPEVIMNIPNYRRFGTHEAMVFNFITDVTNGGNLSGIRWVELRSTNGNDWSVFQEGTLAPDDGLHRFMGSIALDANGNMGLGYNVSSETEFVGVRYTGRLASDPLGEMTFEETIVATGSNPIQSGSRFGDYSDMKLDAVDGRTFWFTTEYAAQGSSRTRIVSFELERDPIDLALTQIISPNTSSNLSNTEQVTIEIANAGLDPVSNFEVGYSLNGTLVEAITLPNTIAADATMTYTFNTTSDLSAIGAYTIEAYVSANGDNNTVNDRVIKMIEQIPLRDGSIEIGEIPLSCTDEVTLPISITNHGEENLTNAEIQIVVNGNSANPQIFDYTGNLPFNGTDVFEVTLVGLSIGDSTVEAELTNVNGNPDPVVSNNFASSNVTRFDEQGQITLTINFDDFPTETSWEIRDQTTNSIIFSGGPFVAGDTQIQELFCLDADACYTLTIFDSYGDGMCCEYGSGNYSISNSKAVIVQGDGIFEDQISADFCPTDTGLTGLDAGIEFTVVPLICGESIEIPIQLFNLGTNTLTEVEIQASLDGGNVQTFIWSGALNFNESEQVILDIQGLEVGDNLLELEVISTNGMPDLEIDNNTISETLELLDDQSTARLELEFDDFPTETTWQLASADGTIRYTGGPYANGEVSFNQSFCLDPGDCYVFTIFDSAGDGICCGLFGDGTYRLIDENGEIIFNSTGEFQQFEIVEFCGDFTSVENTINQANRSRMIVNPNPNNGSFMLEVANTGLTSPLLDIEIYSINGSFIQDRTIGRFGKSYQGQISLVDWADGIYIIKCKTEYGILQTKVVKQ